MCAIHAPHKLDGVQKVEWRGQFHSSTNKPGGEWPDLVAAKCNGEGILNRIRAGSRQKIQSVLYFFKKQLHFTSRAEWGAPQCCQA